MRLLAIFLLLASLLQASNPKLYAGLGDKLYNAMPAVAALGMTESFKQEKSSLDRFVAACADLKEAGLDIDMGREGHMDKKAYLKALRSHDRALGKIMLQAHRTMLESIEGKAYGTFRSVIETGIIDIEAYDHEIMQFYAEHQDKGTIGELEYYKAFKEEQRKVSSQRQKQRNADYKVYREKRIERFKERDKKEKAAFEESLKSQMEQSKKAATKAMEKELILP